jgi:hypothetical protein
MGAADALDYPSVPALQDAILQFRGPEKVAEYGNQKRHLVRALRDLEAEACGIEAGTAASGRAKFGTGLREM